MKNPHSIVILVLALVSVWFLLLVARYDALDHRQNALLALQNKALTDQSTLIQKLELIRSQEFTIGAQCGCLATVEALERLQKEHAGESVRLSDLDPERIMTEALRLNSNSAVEP